MNMPSSSAAVLNPSSEVVSAFHPDKPQPILSSLAAAATRLTSKEVKRIGQSKAEEWQEDAWDMYDLVGEQRFLANTLANRMGQARFFVGKRPRDTTEDLEVVTEGPAYDVFDTMYGKGAHFSQMVIRGGLNLFMPGDCYVVGVPPKEEKKQDAGAVQREGIRPIGTQGDSDDTDPLAGIDLDSLDWRLLSISECGVDGKTGEVTITTDKGKQKYAADDIVLIRVWRPHPRHWWKADSPTRSSLPVLRELVGLTMHISAQVDSRLAGAGVFLVPASADAALRAAAQQGDDGAEEDISPLADALMDAMTTAIEDRGSASALVPIMPVVPDDTIEKFRFISFAGPLDTEARSLRDEAIRRLALGQDCPPELLLGVGGMNHWGAWLVREDVVTTHLEPPLALFCDAITTQFLWPVLELQGVADYEDYVIWYDVDHMIARPNRAQDAKDAKAAGAISDTAFRDALGFDEDAAPDVTKDPIQELVLEMLRTAPSLAQNPGLPMLAAQIKAMLANEVIPAGGEAAPAEDEEASTADSTPEEEPEEGGTPATADQPAEPDAGGEGLSASAGAEVEEII